MIWAQGGIASSSHAKENTFWHCFRPLADRKVDKMKSYTIQLSAREVITLFEMCEACTTIAFRAGNKEDFARILEVQNKLYGCENLESEAPSLLEQTEEELGCGGKYQLLSLRS